MGKQGEPTAHWLTRTWAMITVMHYCLHIG